MPAIDRETIPNLKTLSVNFVEMEMCERLKANAAVDVQVAIDTVKTLHECRRGDKHGETATGMSRVRQAR